MVPQPKSYILYLLVNFKPFIGISRRAWICVALTCYHKLCLIDNMALACCNLLLSRIINCEHRKKLTYPSIVYLTETKYKNDNRQRKDTREMWSITFVLNATSFLDFSNKTNNKKSTIIIRTRTTHSYNLKTTSSTIENTYPKILTIQYLFKW